jgi:DNA-binding response OmpR family regulator
MMVGLRQILVVDDHFEMLEFLHSMLELSNESYRVLGVPSGEEGLLELKRRAQQGEPFDLLITDVRLPGMSGFELARKVRALDPELPIIIITAYASAQGRKEAEHLNIHRYFEKPLDTDALLASVHSALYVDASIEAPSSLAEQAAEDMSLNVRHTEEFKTAQPEAQSEVRRRLRALLSDTGAVQSLLCDRKGNIHFRAGSGRGDHSPERLAWLLARSLTDSFRLAGELGSQEPFTIQYQAGERVDLYTANIGRRAFLILLFDARARRGRIGTVWVFAQRAIKDLLQLLPDAGLSRREDTGALGPPQQAYDTPRRQRKEEASGREQAQDLPQLFEDHSPLGSEEAHEDSEDDQDNGGALLKLLEKAEEMEHAELDAYWDEAMADTEGDDVDGLSFDEAMRRGLLPPGLGE